MASGRDSVINSSDILVDPYRPVTAAIDFGTTSSGYAFAFQKRPDKAVKAKDIHLNQWKKGSSSSTTEKAPTTVLLKPDKSFDSFGYKAENKYAKLCDTGKHKGWRYFQKFKMLLYDSKNLSRDVVIHDAENKPMPAIVVFSIVIGHLKEEMLGEIKIQNNAIKDDDILYVLTVPAIWSDGAKQFMREAATSQDVGISNGQLKLVLEPEAASVYCRQTPSCAVRGPGGSLSLTTIPVGHKYVIVDLGGGTADLASHQVVDDQKLYEIHNARGDDMGGEHFNRRFLEFLSDLVGADVFEKFKRNEKGDYLALQRIVEEIKWEISDNEADEEVVCSMPNSLLKLLELSGTDEHVLENRVKRSKYGLYVNVYGENKLLISLQFIRNMFVDVLKGLEKHIGEIKEGTYRINTLFMVGGLAKSEYVRRHLQKLLPQGTFVVPEDPGVAVLKGAVLLGNRPKMIAGRIAMYSYGLNMGEGCVEDQHDKVHQVEYDGKLFCVHLFRQIIKKGTVMKFGDVFQTVTGTWGKLECLKRQKIHFRLYQSTAENPTYTTEKGCAKIGEIILCPPEKGWDDSSTCTVQIIVGEAEFRYCVKEESGQECEAKVDFLLPEVKEEN